MYITTQPLGLRGSARVRVCLPPRSCAAMAASSSCRRRIVEVAVKATAYADLLPAVKPPWSRAQAAAHYYQVGLRAPSMGHSGVGDAGLSAKSVVVAARPTAARDATHGFLPKTVGFFPNGIVAHSSVGITSGYCKATRSSACCVTNKATTTMGAGNCKASTTSVCSVTTKATTTMGAANYKASTTSVCSVSTKSSTRMVAANYKASRSSLCRLTTTMGAGSSVRSVSTKASTTMGAGNCSAVCTKAMTSTGGFDPLRLLARYKKRLSKGDTPYQYLHRRFLVKFPYLYAEVPLAAKEAEELAQKLTPEEELQLQRVMIDTMAKDLIDSWTTVGAVQKRYPFTGPFSDILNVNKVIDFAAKGIAICAANILLGLILLGMTTVIGKWGDDEGKSSTEDGDKGSPPSSQWRKGLVGILLAPSKDPPATATPIVVSPTIIVLTVGRNHWPFDIPAATLSGVSKALDPTAGTCHIGKDGCHNDEEGRHSGPK